MKRFVWISFFWISGVLASTEPTFYEKNKVQYGNVAIVDASRGRIVEYDLNGKIVWEFNIPWSIPKTHIGKGADIEWLADTDTFLFVVPMTGIYEVNRQKEIIWKYETSKVSHDADRLPNGNILFSFGWDMDNDPTWTEITREGKIVHQWFAKKHLDPKKDKQNSQAESTYSYTHANAVSRLSDGTTLVSLRNFNMYVIVKDDQIIRRSPSIKNVHDPFVSAERSCFGAREPNRAACTNKDGPIFRFIDTEKKWSPMRTIEPLKNGNLLITGSYQIGQLSADGKLVWKLYFNDFRDQKSSDSKSSNSNFIYKAAWVYK
jgi:hypothetical protein